MRHPRLLALLVPMLLPMASAQPVLDKATGGIPTDGTPQGLVVRSAAAARFGGYGLHTPVGTADDRMDIATPVTDLDMPTAYSAMAWVQINTLGNGQGVIMLGNCCTPRNGYTVQIQDTSNGRVRFWGGKDTDTNNYNAYSSGGLNDGMWHHIGIRADLLTVEILVDGVVDGSVNTNVPTSPTLAAAMDLSQHVPQIGGKPISQQNLSDVYIDEVRVYSTRLSDPEWTDAMNNVGPLPDRLYYDFELGPTCTITSPASMAQVSADVSVDFDADHIMMLPVDATLEFSTDAGSTWTLCTPAAGSVNPSPGIVVPATGQTIVWDSVADAIGFLAPESVVLRITVVDMGGLSSTCSVGVDVDNVIPPPTCTVVRPGMGVAMGETLFDIDVASMSAPTVDYLAEFSTDGGATWAPATAAPSSPEPNPAIGAMVGAHQLVWDSRTDGVGIAAILPGVLLRVTVDDGVAFLPGECQTLPFDVDNQQICFGLCGDCDLNGLGPDVLDALEAARIAAGLTTPGVVQFACCDVNSTMSVDVLDSLLIAQFATGLPAMLSCL